ncbi:MAG: alpha-L-rhamnosidase [Chloroflexales bacterium]|nr:alpha-L-rhamnosidase [Chloroflexales bacterium]
MGRYLTYLPGVWADDSFGYLPAAWASGVYGGHAVALFRYNFTLDQPLPAARLEIFADTRYEAWIDGASLGRGPARFSRTTREYDVLTLGALGAGRHLLAVMVQWAPNNRRSESTIPHLRARILGGQTPIAPAPSEWRALQISAWNPDAALVHSWGLLGPSELLDLRRLPAAWASPAFDDNSWRPAIAVQPPAALHQPRSISRLSEIQSPLVVHASGPLMPGYWVGELAPGRDGATSYSFTLSAPTLVSILALSSPDLPDPAGGVTLNGAPLSWNPIEGEPPDLRLASSTLPAGSHQLSVAGLSVAGSPWPFAISTRNITSARPPFGQGTHAGRRLLLAGLIPPVSARARIAQTSASLAFAETPAYAILDLGRTVHGRLVAEVSGAAGAVVDIGWDERLWKGTRPLPYPGSLHPEWNQTDSWVLDGSTRTLTTIDARAGRYILIAAWGPGPVRLDNLRVLEERYPVTLRGSFSSDRPLLNRIWQIGVDTLYANMSDAYADPWRERGQWWGDAHVEDHVNSVAFGDTLLLRRGLLLMAEPVMQNNGRAHALAPSGDGVYLLDYGMLWVQSTRDYLDRTGDTAFVEQIYPATRAFLGFLEQYVSPSTGLIDLPDNASSNLAYIDSSSYLDRVGQTTAVNALYYGTLLDAAAIALAVGDSDSARDYSTRAATVRERVNLYLYRPDRGLYVAAIVAGRETAPSPQAQAIALAYGLPSSDETQRVADALLASLGTPETPAIQVYGMFWVLEGLGRAGRTSEAVDVIERYFGRMVQRGATTWWENFVAIDRYTSSLSHGWGGSPTWFLSQYVLGISLDGPTTWTVRPQTSGLSRAAGAVPLGDSAVQVSWTTPSCSQLALQLSAPEGTSGRAIFPSNGAITRIALNNTVIWADGGSLAGDLVSETSSGIVVALAGGAHSFSVQLTCPTSAHPPERS